MTSVTTRTKTQRDAKPIPQQSTVMGSEEQDQFFSLLSHVQRSTMDDQRCILDPKKKTPNVPVDTNTAHTDADVDQLFFLVANTQRGRLDDQRVLIETLPGFCVTSNSEQDGEGPKKEEQRCTSSQNLLTVGSSNISRNTHSTPTSLGWVQPGSVCSMQNSQKSDFYTPTSDNKKEQNKGAISDSKDQDQFFSLLSHVQRGIMDDQRCLLGPNNNIPSVPKDSDLDQLFNLVANAQRYRLDDQRVSIKTIPGLDQDSHEKKKAAGPKSNQLGNVRAVSDSLDEDKFFTLLSHVQRGIMDDQRCVLDPKKKTPSTHKDKNTGDTDTDIEQLLNLVAATQRYRHDDQRVSIETLPGLHIAKGSNQDGRVKITAEQKSNQPDNTRAVSDSLDEDKFFTLLSHVQRGIMDDQRCVLDPKKKTPSTHKDKNTGDTDTDIEQLLNLVAATQRYRHDDQRLSIETLPGLHIAKRSKQDGHEKITAEQKSNQPDDTGAVLELMDQEQFFSLLSHVQRRNMDEQRCLLDCKKSPNTHKEKNTSHTDPDMDQLFDLVANTQKCRLDDQRVSIGTLPGFKKMSGTDLDGQVKMVFEQKPILLGNMGMVSSLTDQDQFTILCHAQRGNMEDELCIFNPKMRSHQKDSDMIQLLDLAADADKCHLDDQRVGIKTLPAPSGLWKEDQRCPSQNLLTAMAPDICMKAHFPSVSSNQASHAAVYSRQEPGKSDQEIRKDQNTKQEAQQRIASPLDKKDKINKKTCKDTNTRQTDSDGEQLLDLVAKAQKGRLEDQRASMGILPEQQTTSANNRHGRVIQLPDKLSIMDPKKGDQRYSSPLRMLIGSLHIQSGTNRDRRTNMEAAPLQVSGVQGFRIEEQQYSFPPQSSTLGVTQFAGFPRRPISPSQVSEPDECYLLSTHKVHSNQLQGQGRLEEGGRGTGGKERIGEGNKTQEKCRNEEKKKGKGEKKEKKKGKQEKEEKKTGKRDKREGKRGEKEENEKSKEDVVEEKEGEMGEEARGGSREENRTKGGKRTDKGKGKGEKGGGGEKRKKGRKGGK